MSPYARRGTLVRFVYLGVAILCWALTLGRRRKRGAVVTLCYHGVSDEMRESFRRQAEVLAECAISSKELESRKTGRRTGIRVCVTFDDAFENLLRNALPLLEQYHIPATVFAVAENLGETPRWTMPAGHPEANVRLMDARQLAELAAKHNVTIGSHTATHLDLATLPTECIRSELMRSRRELERLISQPVVELALPYGSFNDTVLRVAREAGYARVYTLEPRGHCPQHESFIIGRFAMSPDAWPIEFALTIRGCYAWSLTLRMCVSRVRRLVFKWL